jgi:hypothetical protein
MLVISYAAGIARCVPGKREKEGRPARWRAFQTRQE